MTPARRTVAAPLAVLLAALLASFIAPVATATDLYRFTGVVNGVINPRGPLPSGALPFAAGQPVAGSFRYAPEDATLSGPTDGTADYASAIRDFTLSIDLGPADYHFAPPNLSTQGPPFLQGRPLGRASVSDNVVVDDGAGLADSFTLTHANQLFFGVPIGEVAPSAVINNYMPLRLSYFWSTQNPAAAGGPTFIEQFQLPSHLLDLFDRSASDNWALAFGDLAAGLGDNPPLVNVTGRIQELWIVPEPLPLTLAAWLPLLLAKLGRR